MFGSVNTELIAVDNCGVTRTHTFCDGMVSSLIIQHAPHVLSFLYFGFCGSQIWTDVDNNRTGDLPFVFDDDFGYGQCNYFDGHILVNSE
jgi:hypothetical protein